MTEEKDFTYLKKFLQNVNDSKWYTIQNSRWGGHLMAVLRYIYVLYSAICLVGLALFFMGGNCP